MALNLLILALLIVLAYLFALLFVRFLRSRSLIGKVLGAALSAVLGVAVVAALGLGLLGLWRAEAPRDRPMADLQVTATPEQVALGRELAQSCVPCHSYDGTLVLNGGQDNLASAWGPLNEVYGANLTPGGSLRRWKDGAIIRALREGIDADGVPLLLHPAHQYRGMSDADAEALVAYLRSQPALRHDQPRRSLSFITLLNMALGRLVTAEQPPLPASQ